MILVSFLLGGFGISVPMAYYVGFTRKLGLLGIWYGLTAGYTTITAIACVGLVLGNWNKSMQAAMARSQRKGFSGIAAVTEVEVATVMPETEMPPSGQAHWPSSETTPLLPPATVN